jgi:hypothetical protein
MSNDYVVLAQEDRRVNPRFTLTHVPELREDGFLSMREIAYQRHALEEALDRRYERGL